MLPVIRDISGFEELKGSGNRRKLLAEVRVLHQEALVKDAGWSWSIM